jgi:N-acetyl-gamma-glutamyl-phosphate reductase
MRASVSVLGASGYTGAELLRLLGGHASVDVVSLGAGRRAGQATFEVLPHLAGWDGPPLQTAAQAASVNVDVCFSCLPSGELGDVVGDVAADIIVDLGDGFRADPDWVYGITEFVRDQLPGATRIANPGCYPTASLLSLVPFARAGLIGSPVVIDALSGSSGAGRKEEDRLLFASLDNNAFAYGSTEHRHVPEMERGLETFGLSRLSVSFTPHLVPMARGVLVTARAPLARDVTADEVIEVLEKHYAGEAFVTTIPDWPSTKAVMGTNRAFVSARIDARNSLLICSAAIDNLGKGAAGQAIQNANLALGLPESTGLEGFGLWP